VQCELACYRGAAPNRLQYPFRLARPIFEVLPGHLSRRYDLTVCPGGKNSFCTIPQLSKKAIIIVLLMHAFFRRGELFVCHSHSAVWSRDRSQTPMFHLLLLLYPKNLAQFRVFPANPDKFPTGLLFAPQTNFLHVQMVS